MSENRKIDKIQKLGEKGNTRKIIPYTQSSSAQERAAAAVALGNAKDDDAYNALIAMLRDSDVNVRISTVTALGQAGRKDTAEHIRHVSNSEGNEALREACLKAVAALLAAT